MGCRRSAIKRFDRCRNEVDQFEPSGNEGGLFSGLRGNLLNRVDRVFQIQQGLKPLEVSSYYTRTIG
jgi:hypothetical protein